jgi:hypothetical protein
MELPDAVLKIGAPGKEKHFQKDFFYRLVINTADWKIGMKDNIKENPQSGSNGKGIAQDVLSIFEDSDVSIEIKLSYLHSLTNNLSTTEKAIGSDFFRIILCFTAFILLDSGMVDKVSISGTDIKGTGVILLLFPIIIAFLTYQMNHRVSFTHEIRKTIALIYRYIYPGIYKHALDFLTHYPSVRNIESYHGKLLNRKGQIWLDYSTSFVTLIMALAPLIAVVYCLLRTFKRDDVSIFIWLPAVIITACFFIHIFVLQIFQKVKDDDWYAKREIKSKAVN